MENARSKKQKSTVMLGFACVQLMTVTFDIVNFLVHGK